MGGHKRAPSGAALVLQRVRRHVLKFVALAALLVPVVAVVADQGEPAASGRDGAPDDSEGQYPEAQDWRGGTRTHRESAQMSATGTPSPQPTAGRPGAGGLPSDPSPTPAGGPTATGSPSAGGDDETPGSPSGRPSGSPDEEPNSPPGDTPGRPDDAPSSPSSPSSPPDDEPEPSPSSPGSPSHEPDPEPEPEPTAEPPKPPKPSPSPSPTPKPSPPSEPPPEDDDDGSLVCVVLLGIEICL